MKINKYVEELKAKSAAELNEELVLLLLDKFIFTFVALTPTFNNNKKSTKKIIKLTIKFDFICKTSVHLYTYNIILEKLF